MHMADALLNPAVGGAAWAVTGATVAWSASRVRTEMDDRKVPLMGVLGAFVFAAQMINFTIPGTGSSGHLGGGMILSILLGPPAAFLTMASILTVQALFFGDGGLLALGCNIFNLGFIPALLAYPFVYRPIVGERPTAGRLSAAAVLSSVIALQAGALGVVLETTVSGISDLPFLSFLMVMQPIHLGIGLVEGLVTAAVVAFVWKARPEILGANSGATDQHLSMKGVLVALAVVAVLTGGALSWFASGHPDGLEWSVAKVTGSEELEAPGGGIHDILAGIQEKTAFLPDYGFPGKDGEDTSEEAWPAVSPGTTVSGLVGGLLTLALALLLGLVLRRKARAGSPREG